MSAVLAMVDLTTAELVNPPSDAAAADLTVATPRPTSTPLMPSVTPTSPGTTSTTTTAGAPPAANPNLTGRPGDPLPAAGRRDGDGDGATYCTHSREGSPITDCASRQTSVRRSVVLLATRGDAPEVKVRFEPR
jgi:hypothetical protein